MTDLETKIAELKDIPTEENLTTLLREKVMVVTFTKLNGDERIMTCTKSFDIIPEDQRPKTTSEPKKGNITVWDLNAKGWRSFKYDRVRAVSESQ